MFTKHKNAGGLPQSKKNCIYITARIHPGETHASHIVSHFMKELTSNYTQYDNLLQNNIIYIIPMLNPDGVVLGNARSSLAGCDLNRRWGDPSHSVHPELFFLKQYMQKAAKASNGISLFVDLHGHNKDFNCFFYGCNKAPSEGLISWTKTRLLPKIFETYEPILNYNKCKFS